MSETLEESIEERIKYSGGKMDSIFMYVRNFCPHSKHAAMRAMKFTKNVQCYELEKNKYVSCNNLYDVEAEGDGMEKKFKFRTVPQIFVQVQKKWYYIGGRDDFDLIEANTTTKTKVGPNQYKF
tara:strand:- start:435 stop:806 length:372 start_codon:yes stop_codon:yes gene_type:complete